MNWTALFFKKNSGPVILLIKSSCFSNKQTMVALKTVPYSHFKWPPCKIASAVASHTHMNTRIKMRDKSARMLITFSLVFSQTEQNKNHSSGVEGFWEVFTLIAILHLCSHKNAIGNIVR